MPNVTSNAQKSEIPFRYSKYGVDVEFGQRIIFEHDGDTYLGYCQGWLLVDGEPKIKTDMIFESGIRLDVPLDKAWRIYDARDDLLEWHETERDNLRRFVAEIITHDKHGFVNDSHIADRAFELANKFSISELSDDNA